MVTWDFDIELLKHHLPTPLYMMALLYKQEGSWTGLDLVAYALNSELKPAKDPSSRRRQDFGKIVEWARPEDAISEFFREMRGRTLDISEGNAVLTSQGKAEIRKAIREAKGLT